MQQSQRYGHQGLIGVVSNVFTTCDNLTVNFIDYALARLLDPFYYFSSWLQFVVFRLVDLMYK